MRDLCLPGQPHLSCAVVWLRESAIRSHDREQQLLHRAINDSAAGAPAV
jgi:hypothetical protein